MDFDACTKTAQRMLRGEDEEINESLLFVGNQTGHRIHFLSEASLNAFLLSCFPY